MRRVLLTALESSGWLENVSKGKVADKACSRMGDRVVWRISRENATKDALLALDATCFSTSKHSIIVVESGDAINFLRSYFKFEDNLSSVHENFSLECLCMLQCCLNIWMRAVARKENRECQGQCALQLTEWKALHASRQHCIIPRNRPTAARLLELKCLSAANVRHNRYIKVVN